MDRSKRLAPLLLCLLVAVIAAAGCHIRALSAGFLFDDHVVIVNNPFIDRIGNAAVLLDPRRFFQPYPVTCGARPLTLLSLMADRAVWGKGPFGYHLTNILLHAANTALVLVLALTLFRKWRPACSFRSPIPLSRRASALLEPFITGGYAFALFAALVFALHPVQVETVAIASFRADLLSALFYLSAFLLFIAASDRKGKASWLRYAGALLCFLLGLFAKEMALTLPFVLLLHILLFKRQGGLSRRAVAVIAGAGSMALLFILFYWRSRFVYPWHDAVYPALADGGSPLASATAYLSTILAAALHYARALVWPVGLSMEYQVALPATLLTAANVTAAAVLAGGVAVLALVKDRLLRLALGMAAVSYLPVSNIVPLINVIDDRYLYLPMVGISLFAAGALLLLNEESLPVKLPVKFAIAVLVLAACAGVTAQRSRLFADDHALYADAARHAPRNVRARYNLGIACMVRGEYRAALRELDTAGKLNPGFRPADLCHLKALSHEALGETAAAKQCYAAALTLDPGQETVEHLVNLLLDESEGKLPAR